MILVYHRSIHNKQHSYAKYPHTWQLPCFDSTFSLQYKFEQQSNYWPWSSSIGEKAYNLPHHGMDSFFSNSSWTTSRNSWTIEASICSHNKLGETASKGLTRNRFARYHLKGREENHLQCITTIKKLADAPSTLDMMKMHPSCMITMAIESTRSVMLNCANLECQYYWYSSELRII